MLLILLASMFCLTHYVSAYIQPQQFDIIRKIMSNSETPIEIKVKTRRILIKNYLSYALSLSRTFRKNLKSKKYIINNAKDLNQYAVQGLVHSVRRYNGQINLYPYAKKYIMGYLYYGITELSPLKQLSHYERYTKKIRLPATHLSSDIWYYDKLSEPSNHNKLCEKARDIYNEISMLTPKQKQILFYRYDPITLKKKRTWKEVANLMACSTETLRKKVKEIKVSLSNAKDLI